MGEIFIVEAILEAGGTRVKFNIPYARHFEYISGSRPVRDSTWRLFPYQYNLPEILERLRVWSPAKKKSNWKFVEYPFVITKTKRHVLANYWKEDRVSKKDFATKITQIRTRYIANDRKGDKSTYNNFED